MNCRNSFFFIPCNLIIFAQLTIDIYKSIPIVQKKEAKTKRRN